MPVNLWEVVPNAFDLFKEAFRKQNPDAYSGIIGSDLRGGGFSLCKIDLLVPLNESAFIEMDESLLVEMDHKWLASG